MDNNIKKVISLVKKTGDRLVVYDPDNSDNIFVIMSIAEYEKLIIGKSEVRNLTENELLDKINRDIAIWKSEQNNEESGLRSFTREPGFFADNRLKYTIRDDRDNMDDMDNGWYDDEAGMEGEDQIEDFTNKVKNSKHHWGIPSDRKESAEEVIIEEDRQYLETINE